MNYARQHNLNVSILMEAVRLHMLITLLGRSMRCLLSRESTIGGEVVQPVEDGVGKCKIWMVLVIVKFGMVLWAVGSDMLPWGGMTCRSIPCQVLKFERGVRRVALILLYDNVCACGAEGAGYTIANLQQMESHMRFLQERKGSRRLWGRRF